MKRHSGQYSKTYSWGELITNGVKFVYGANEQNCYIDNKVKIGKGTEIWPGVILDDDIEIGKSCIIGKSAIIIGKIQIGDRVQIDENVKITGNGYISDNSRVGHKIHNPQIGKNCVVLGQVFESTIADGCFIGEDMEITRSTIGANTNAKHHGGIRDAEVGHEVNFSGGANIWNYDGSFKKKTKIGNRVFIGGGARIMGGVEIGDESFIAENSLVNRNIPAKSFFVNKTPGAKIETINDNCSWYLDGNYLNLKYPVDLKLRESFYVKAYRLCGQSSDAMKEWLKTPNQHMGGRTPIECIKKEGEKSFACLLHECGYPEKACSYNKK